MGNKRKLEVITISSDDDDDDVPLKVLGAQSSTANGLKTYCVQQCEFCDEAFLNKYDMLIHNAKHIIIPLLKQSTHQCMECHICFSTRKELKHHMKQIHNLRLEITDKKANTKHENEKNEEIGNKLKLKDVRVDVVDIKCMKDDLNAKDRNSEAILKLKDITVNLVDIKTVNDVIKTRQNAINIPVENRIRNRLKFEDDDCIETSVNLLNDLTKECKVNMNLFDEPWVDTDTNVPAKSDTEIIDLDVESETVGKADAGTIYVGSKIVGKPDAKAVVDVESKTVGKPDAKAVVDVESKTEDIVESGNEEFTPSTHFEDLVKPGMYRCKRCQQIFSTRFQLIQHDMSHIKIRKPRPLLCEFCERFISTSRLELKQHLMTHSPELWNHKQRMHTTCQKCGLKYHSYKKHVENYHELVYCHLCYQGFDSNEERLDHIREHLVETKCPQCDLVSTAIEIAEHQRACHKTISTIQICETCSLFVKNNHNIDYVFLENISEMGTRLTCEHCKKKFFELKLLRRFHKSRREKGGEKKKGLSNTDRLKNIQQRLKMINKLSRF